MDLSKRALETLEFLGNFGPTSNPKDKKLKGWTYSGAGAEKTYLTAEDVRDMAQDLLEVAQALEDRASKDHQD
jgi:hypothetical protein